MKNNKTPLSIAIGSTLLSGLAVTAVQANEVNPFSVSELDSGYMQLAAADTATETTEASSKKKEGSCGEGKCGAKTEDGEKTEDSSKTKEGKCGEGKCGAKTEDGSKTEEGKPDANKK